MFRLPDQFCIFDPILGNPLGILEILLTLLHNWKREIQYLELIKAPVQITDLQALQQKSEFLISRTYIETNSILNCQPKVILPNLHNLIVI